MMWDKKKEVFPNGFYWMRPAGGVNQTVWRLGNTDGRMVAKATLQNDGSWRSEIFTTEGLPDRWFVSAEAGKRYCEGPFISSSSCDELIELERLGKLK